MEWLRGNVVVASVSVWGCGPAVDVGERDDGGSGSDGGEATAASEGSMTSSPTGDPAGDDDPIGEATGSDACPPADPNASFVLRVEFPNDDPPDAEGGTIERNVLCDAEGGGGGPGYSELFFQCVEPDGVTTDEFVVHLEMTGDPLAGIDWEQQVLLGYRRWWAFEGGEGQGLSLTQNGSVMMAAYQDHFGAGTVGVCATPPYPSLASVQQWFASFPASFELGVCDDPAAVGMIVPAQDGSETLAYPGSQGVVAGVSYVYAEGRCDATNGENWALSTVLWR